MVLIKQNSIDLENGDIDNLSNLIGADLANAANGEVPQADGSGGLSMGSISAGGKFEDALANGKVLADDGNLYNSIQTAVDNASVNGYVLVGVGDFNENVTISTEGITLVGTGTVLAPASGDGLTINSSNISVKNFNYSDKNGTAGEAVDVNGDNVLIKKLTVLSPNNNLDRGILINLGYTNCIVKDSVFNKSRVTTNGDETLIQNVKVDSYNGTTSGAIDATDANNPKIKNCTVVDSSSDGITCENTGVVTDCFVKNSSGKGINRPEIVSNCKIIGSGEQNINIIFQSESLITNNKCIGGSERSIELNEFDAVNDCVIDGNIVLDSGSDGIYIGPDCNDNIVSNNRVKNSTNSDINDNGTNTALNGNITGNPN